MRFCGKNAKKRNFPKLSRIKVLKRKQESCRKKIKKIFKKYLTRHTKYGTISTERGMRGNPRSRRVATGRSYKTPLTKSSTARSPVVRDINVNQALKCGNPSSNWKTSKVLGADGMGDGRTPCKSFFQKSLKKRLTNSTEGAIL